MRLVLVGSLTALAACTYITDRETHKVYWLADDYDPVYCELYACQSEDFLAEENCLEYRAMDTCLAYDGPAAVDCLEAMRDYCDGSGSERCEPPCLIMEEPEEEEEGGGGPTPRGQR